MKTKRRSPIFGEVARAWFTLVLLGLLYFVSFVDRFILALLVVPLQADLGVSQLQIGLLFGTAFALFYAILGLPLARLADRSNRRNLIAAGAVLWSVSTIASGLVDTFVLLVALRIGLAIGEATLTPSAYSMIGDLFPVRQRRRAASIYSAFGMLGAGGGYIVGGLVIGLVSSNQAIAASEGFRVWQLVLIAVGTPSLILALLFAFTVREPVRNANPSDGAGRSLRDLLGYLRSDGAVFAGLIVGAGLCQVPAYAMIAWMPYTLQHDFGITAQDSGYIFGVVAIIATVSGTLLLPWVTERIPVRSAGAAAPLVSGASAFAGVAMLVAASQMSSLSAFVAFSGMGLLLLTGATNNILVAFQILVPGNLRATVAALCLLSITLCGLGGGPPLFALLDQTLSAFGAGELAMPAVAILSVLPGAGALLVTARTLTRRGYP